MPSRGWTATKSAILFAPGCAKSALVPKMAQKRDFGRILVDEPLQSHDKYENMGGLKATGPAQS